MIHSYKYQINP